VLVSSTTNEPTGAAKNSLLFDMKCGPYGEHTVRVASIVSVHRWKLRICSRYYPVCQARNSAEASAFCWKACTLSQVQLPLKAAGKAAPQRAGPSLASAAAPPTPAVGTA